MPTTLPDRTARARERRRHLLAEFTPVVAVMLYLLLLAWNLATFEANFSGPRAGEYNPMEPGHRTAVSPTRPTAWLAQR
jgi:hypothetical protein